jgi:hypothetical protein
MNEPKAVTNFEMSGGCQCGAVRFVISQPPKGVHFCHCRMCQRAVGNVFAARVQVKRTAVRWLDEEPAQFASSTVARRGFCPHCGTPISLAYNESEWIALSLGSFDTPEELPPTIECGIESRLPFIHPRADCEQEQTGVSCGYTQGMIKQQFERVED